MSNEETPEKEKKPTILESLMKIAHLMEPEPEPQCSICGRIIFCGVDELCKADPCGLKDK